MWYHLPVDIMMTCLIAMIIGSATKNTDTRIAIIIRSVGITESQCVVIDTITTSSIVMNRQTMPRTPMLILTKRLAAVATTAALDPVVAIATIVDATVGTAVAIAIPPLSLVTGALIGPHRLLVEALTTTAVLTIGRGIEVVMSGQETQGTMAITIGEP